MDSAAHEALFMAREQNTEGSRCPMVLLPPETKMQIISHICTQESLSRLGQSCRAWYEVANEELYKRDSREYSSFAIKWMAAHAVDEQTTDSALRTLDISRRWGGQIDVTHRGRDIPRTGFYAMVYRDLYIESTALHFAVVVGNLRLTETLLDMKASLTTPCSPRLWSSKGSKELLRKFSYFKRVLDLYFCPFHLVYPIFLAFLQSDTDMCKLFVKHGAGREATIDDSDNDPKVFSILHFAAADQTTDYRQWQFLFDSFRDYIDEPCPRRDRLTPLHIALMSGCTQGMQIAVEAGADKEAKARFQRALHTPLSMGIRRLSHHKVAEEQTTCLQKFVELGGNVNPKGDSLLVLAVKLYAPNPVDHPLIRHLIYSLLDHHADMHKNLLKPKTNVVNEIIEGIFKNHDNPRAVELLKQLLGDLLDRGLNLTILDPRLPSPFYRILNHGETKPEWLVDLLCEKGATIHEHEVDSAFRTWCHTSRLWETNKYDAWWQHQGQEDRIFTKWCEHPYNAWWWQHVKQISPRAATQAYGAAFDYEDRQLYDILTHLPFPAPLDGLLVKVAYTAQQLWGWRLVVLHEFEDNFLARWLDYFEENMIHLTICKYVTESCYSAADAMLDILHLRDKGVDMTLRNVYGQTPLEILLESGSCKDDFSEMVTLFGGKVHEELASGPSENAGLEQDGI
ncbi:hypothetical protein E4U61_006678 [Claviceps capensis]|nr:hypothetical protein E4U61_006678 [Claviceps capensis]